MICLAFLANITSTNVLPDPYFQPLEIVPSFQQIYRSAQSPLIRRWLVMVLCHKLLSFAGWYRDLILLLPRCHFGWSFSVGLLDLVPLDRISS